MTDRPVEPPEGSDWHEENASVEVWRWGGAVRVAIRSENSVGKSIELPLPDARDLAERLLAAVNSNRRKVKDEPQS